MVREEGFEPPRACARQLLRLLRLPVPPFPHDSWQEPNPIMPVLDLSLYATATLPFATPNTSIPVYLHWRSLLLQIDDCIPISAFYCIA